MVAASTLAVALLVPTGATSAQAQSVEDIEAEIDAAWRELEPLIEDYNKVTDELKENKKASDTLEEKIEPLAEEAGAAEEELSTIAAGQYRAGPLSAFQALVTSGSPTTFVDRLATLEQIALDQERRISEADEVRTGYEQQKAEVDALIEEQEEQEAELAERAETIEAELAELEEMREEAEEQAQQEQGGQDAGQPQPDGSCPAVATSGAGATAAEFACAQRGKPYSWGAAGPDAYDCSGLTQQAWAAAGVSLSHYTGSQWNEGAVVSRAEAVPGDLVFFYSDLSHVGLYIGDGLMVHASRAGEPVQMQSIDVMPISGFRRPG